MNDSFEDRLRALQPGCLPPELAARLDRPPPASVTPARIRSLRLLVTAGAAAALALAARHALLPPPDGPAPADPAAAAQTPAFAGQRSTEITGVRPLAVITDESNRPWKLVEVNWVEEDTYVFSARPAVVRTQDRYRTVVPVAVRFD